MWGLAGASRRALVGILPTRRKEHGQADQNVELETSESRPAGLRPVHQRCQDGRQYWRKFDGLRPKDDSLESFLVWLIEIGHDPAGLDVMDLYIDTCELAGWSLPVDPANVQTPPEIVPADPPPPLQMSSRPRPLTKAEALVDLQMLRRTGREIPSQDWLKSRWRLASKGSVSKWVTEWEAARLIPTRIRAGKCNTIEAESVHERAA
jgi:hypothetical protein